MCERKSLPLMDMPRNEMFEGPIRKRYGFEKWVKSLHLRRTAISSLTKLNTTNSIHKFMSFIAGGQAWNYFYKTHKDIHLTEDIQKAALSYSNIDITIISECNKTQEFKSFVLWVYEIMIGLIIEHLRTTFLCKEDKNSNFCFQLYLNDKLFDIEKVNIYDPVKCKVDFDAYEFVIYLTYNKYRINQTLFKFDFWNISEHLPPEWFNEKKQEFVTDNYMLNVFGLALFNTILGEARAEEKGFAVDILRRDILKEYFIKRGDINRPPEDIALKTDYESYNYFMMIKQKYKSLFQDTKAYNAQMEDFIYSLALKTIPEFKTIFDSIEEKYVLKLRPQLNAFIVYLSKVLKQYHIRNYIGISGGDAYRRWTDTINKTADIDTKLYIPFEQPNLIDRIEQELIVLSFYLKKIWNTKNKEFKILDKYQIDFQLSKSDFRVRHIEIPGVDLKLFSIDIRCPYFFKDKRYSYSVAVLDIPIVEISQYTKKYGYDPTVEFVKFTCNWKYSDEKDKIDEDFRKNKWPPFEQAKLYVMSPLVLKHDIEKVIYAQIEIYASGREIAGKREKDKIRYNSICESCEYYMQHEKSTLENRTQVNDETLANLNEADVNTYAFFCAINYAVVYPLCLKNFNVRTFLENIIMSYGVFNILKIGLKTSLPYTINNIHKNIDTLIDSQEDSALKRKNATIYCQKTQEFIDRLVERSFIGKKYFENIKKCSKNIEPEDFDFSRFLTEDSHNSTLTNTDNTDDPDTDKYTETVSEVTTETNSITKDNPEYI